jgi:hypothetical protein
MRFLVPPLPMVEEAKDKDGKLKTTNLIKFMLKQRAGSTATAPAYKLKAIRFCEETVEEWINFQKAILELWRQTGIANMQHREANISTILRQDLLTGLEEKFKNSPKRIQRKPYATPKIQELLHKLKGFQHVTSLDLIMEFYHIRLTPNASGICMVILPWGKYNTYAYQCDCAIVLISPKKR